MSPTSASGSPTCPGSVVPGASGVPVEAREGRPGKEGRWRGVSEAISPMAKGSESAPQGLLGGGLPELCRQAQLAPLPWPDFGHADLWVQGTREPLSSVPAGRTHGQEAAVLTVTGTAHFSESWGQGPGRPGSGPWCSPPCGDVGVTVIPADVRQPGDLRPQALVSSSHGESVPETPLDPPHG